MQRTDDPGSPRALPDWFVTVAEDVLSYCRPREGIWVDLGCGSGGVGLALARASGSTVVLIEPNADSLSKGLESARSGGLDGRIVPIVARAEDTPLPDDSVDLVVSRGSIFFWSDPPAGLREVWRVLRPGCRAMIGGGFGSSYPEWARKGFCAQRQTDAQSRGPEAVRKWNEPRRPEWLVEQARAAGIEDALITPAPPGLWLLFQKRGEKRP